MATTAPLRDLCHPEPPCGEGSAFCFGSSAQNVSAEPLRRVTHLGDKRYVLGAHELLLR